MAKKIIYFTAGPTPTATENAEIALLNNLGANYTIAIRNGAKSASFGYGAETCDLVAGTVPSSHTAKTVYGGIDALKPTCFCISPNPVAISGVGTKQLTPIAITGNSLDNLTATALTANVTYVSSVPGKATVSTPGGLVTGVAAGSTVITATYTYASGKTVTATCPVTVT